MTAVQPSCCPKKPISLCGKPSGIASCVLAYSWYHSSDLDPCLSPLTVLTMRGGRTHFFNNPAASSPPCIRVRCCLKLSKRGHILPLRVQLFPKHMCRTLGPRMGFCLWTHFLCRAKSLMVPKPSLRAQFGSSHLNNFLCLASCFLCRV